MGRLRLESHLANQESFVEAERMLTQLEEENALDPNPDPEFQSRLLIGRAVINQRYHGKFEDSIALFEKARTFAKQLPNTTLRESVDRNLAITYYRLDNYQKAEAIARELIDLQSVRGNYDITLNRNRESLVEILIRLRRLDEALSIALEAERYLSSVLGTDSREVFSLRNDIAIVHLEKQMFEQAAVEFEKVFHQVESIESSAPVFAIVAETNWAQALAHLGRTNEAVHATRDALARSRKLLSETHPRVQAIRYTLAAYLLDLKQPTEPVELLQGVETYPLQQFCDLRDAESWLLYQQGRIALQTGKANQALAHFEHAQQLLAGRDPDASIDGRELEPSLNKAIREAQAALHRKTG